MTQFDHSAKNNQEEHDKKQQPENVSWNALGEAADREVMKSSAISAETSSFSKTLETYCSDSNPTPTKPTHCLSLTSDMKHDVLDFPSFTLKRTELGHSIVDLFFLRHLHPLDWQRPEVHKDAADLISAIQEVLDDSTKEDWLGLTRQGISRRQELERQRQAEAMMANKSGNSDWDDDLWMRPCNIPKTKNQYPIREKVERVVEFWHRMELLLMAAHFSTLDFLSVRFRPSCEEINLHESKHGGKRQWRVVHALAKTNCPEEVARLAVALYPAQTKERDEDGLLPLHIAAASPSYTSTSMPESNDMSSNTSNVSSGPAPAMMKVLLQKYPRAAQCTDPQGRLPLYVALASGKTWDTGVQILVQACPDVLLFGTRDIKTRLFSFLMAAVVVEYGEQFIRCKRRASRSIGGMWRLLPPNAKERVFKEAQEEVEYLQLTTIFELLRAMPEVVRSGITSLE
eukprot:CAMPEP_0195309454 /NCGR_PEP_ID=MMETSP0707-20130614/38746_1 /TAXON_ID=33640 /ORGANISM="Asterionellopsis glacialis, Strain CCMP134" /LENGTH=456 /DNA_ID=CAMNT_0040373751 /DNA_START=492 /DNA_END=1862 /DNA_ORIENTATION=+